MSRDSISKSTDSPQKKLDIWSLALRQKKSVAEEQAIETTLMVVGCKTAGKSSLIHRLQNKDDLPAATTALEYRFARSTRGTIKDVSHIWELAGGTLLTDLIDIPVSETNIHLTTFVVVVDLSEPAESIPILEHFLDKIQIRCRKILDGLEARGSKRPKGLKAFAFKKYGSEHPDVTNDCMNLCPVPIIIIGSKYDIFRDSEPEKRKLVCKLLRFLAHTNGATLAFANLKDESSCVKVKRILNHYAFRSNPLVECTSDYNKPVVITPGQDTFSQIGLPPSESGKDAIGKQAFSSYDKWRNDFDRYFLRSKKDSESKADAIDFGKFGEQRVDTMRAQKEEELDRMRRIAATNSDKKMAVKEILAIAAGGGGGNTSQRASGTNGRGYSRAKAMGMAQ